MESKAGVTSGNEGKDYSLFVGVPTFGKPDSMFAIDSGWQLMYHIGRRHPEIKSVKVQRDVRTYRQEARQAIVLGAQSQKATHLLMLDDDHVFDGKVFDKVWDLMLSTSDDVMLTSALYYTRGETPAPCIFKLTKEGTAPIFFYEDNVPQEVDVVGFGFALFDMRLFEKLNPPWFNLAMGFGEDAALCARMIQGGFKVMVHAGAKIGHIRESPQVIGESEYKFVREVMIRDKTESVEAGELVPTGEVSARAVLAASERSAEGQGAPEGVKPVETGYAAAARPWWRPSTSRVWTADRRDPQSLELKGQAEGSDASGGAEGQEVEGPAAAHAEEQVSAQ